MCERQGILGVLVLMVLCGCGESDGDEKISVPPRSREEWVKKGIVLEPKEAWESNRIYNFTSPAEPLGGGRWRIWYSVYPPMNIAVAEGVPGEEFSRYAAVLREGEPADEHLSIGNLPAGWRPTQSVHIELWDGTHRLYFWAHSREEGVVRFLAAESEDGRRYRVLNADSPCLYHPSDRAVEGSGITEYGVMLKGVGRSRPAGESAARAELITNDVATVYQFEDGSFELYAASLHYVGREDPRRAHTDLGDHIRVIDRLVSEDGLSWGGRTRAVEPDGDDPVDLQFYYLSVVHAGGGRIGFLGRYEVDEQFVDVEWCYSDNGVEWERPFRRACIERGLRGEGDSYGIYAGSSLVYHEGCWWFFYTGTNFAHNGSESDGVPRNVIMLARTE